MTRINTNINSLTAMNSLARSSSQLSMVMTRLSTGLKINAGADEPSGIPARPHIASSQPAAVDTSRRAITVPTSGAGANAGTIGAAAQAGSQARAQILAQRGHVVAALANSLPPDVFSLLSG